MAESNAATQLTPGELDLLEDALELCEVPGYEPSDEMSAQVVTRLEDYREILAITREALTVEDVPTGLLDGVLAEARAAAPESVVPTSSSEGWWARLRRSLVLPGVAVVATAVVVLVLVQPQGAQAPEASLAKIEARVEQQPAPPAPSPGASADDGIKADASAADKEEEELDEPEFGVEEKVAQKEAYGERKDAETISNAMAPPREPRKVSKKSADPLPAPSSEVLLEDAKYDQKSAPALEKDELRPLLDQADDARRAGNCAKAIPLYEQVKHASGYYGSRATAGLGLCAYRQGNDSQADEYLASARAQSGSIQDWIDTEMAQLEREALNSKSKRARSKKSSKKQSKASPPQQANAL